jgi:hypothetical protein
MGYADDAVQCGCVAEVLYPVIQLRLTRSGQSARRTVIGWQRRRRRDWSGLRYGYIRGDGRSTHGNRSADVGLGGVAAAMFWVISAVVSRHRFAVVGSEIPMVDRG